MAPHYHFVLWEFKHGRKVGSRSMMTYKHRMGAQRAAISKTAKFGPLVEWTTMICRETRCDAPGTFPWPVEPF